MSCFESKKPLKDHPIFQSKLCNPCYVSVSICQYFIQEQLCAQATKKISDYFLFFSHYCRIIFKQSVLHLIVNALRVFIALCAVLESHYSLVKGKHATG